MKKITYIFAAAALIALAASCQVEPVHQEIVPEETIETVEPAETIITFAATIGEDPAAPGTRATIDGDMPIWEAGDQITIRAYSTDDSKVTIPSGYIAGYSASPSLFTTTSAALESGGSSSATFSFSASGDTKGFIDAAYSYFAWNNTTRPVQTYEDKTTISVEGDKAQFIWSFSGWSSTGFNTALAQTFERAQLRVAYSKDKNLAFKNVYHLLKFSSHCNGASYAVLTSRDGTTKICGSQAKVYLNTDTGEISSVGYNSLSQPSIYLDMTNYGGNGTDYYFALLPGVTIPGFTIKIYDSSDNELQTFTYSSNFTTVRNKITTITNFDGRSTLSRKPQLLNGIDFNVAVKSLASQANGSGVIDNETLPDDYVSSFAISFSDAGSYSEEAGVCTKVSADGSLFDIWATYSSGTITLRTAAAEMAANTTTDSMFRSFRKLTSVSFLSSVDMTNTTTAQYMFLGCNKLSTVPALNMPNVTYTAYMFYSCSSLTALNLSGVEGSVTGVSNMFYGCTNLGSVIFSDDFETFSCTDYANIFKNCTSLRSIVMKGFHIGQTAVPSNKLETKLGGALTNVTNCTIYYSDLEAEGTYTFSNCWAALSLDDYSTGISNITWNNGRP
ncbi:MAG: leucine-rich repeat protein [Bacteroidales bacterium]|nr:leucine-rich repeat protein [Bacteroidales bacterium]